MEQRKKQIADAVLDLFVEHGVSFKVDDVAKRLNMSKKTIYKAYRSKEELIFLVVEAILESIAHQLEHILTHSEYDVVEKLIRVTCAFPDTNEIDYHKALKIKKDFPRAYEMFITYIEDHWELSYTLFQQAIEENRMYPMDYDIFKTIILGISKQVLESDVEDKAEFLDRCIRQSFRGLLLPDNGSVS